MDTTDKPNYESADEISGVVLVGAKPIKDHLISLGMPETTDPYYLRKTGKWPIGSTSGDAGGGKLIAIKQRLTRYVMKLARGSTSAA